MLFSSIPQDACGLDDTENYPVLVLAEILLRRNKIVLHTAYKIDLTNQRMCSDKYGLSSASAEPCMTSRGKF